MLLQFRQPLVLILLVTLLVPALWWARPADAEGPAGRFISIQGSAEVLRGSQTIAATEQLALQAGDVIRTGANARVAILLLDGTKLKLGANATVHLKHLSPERLGKVAPVAAEGSTQTLMRFFLGQGWLQKTGPVDALEIETPTVRAATKGTEFAVEVTPDGGTVVSVLSGHVHVANPKGEVLVADGEQAWIAGRPEWMNLAYGALPKQMPFLGGETPPAKRVISNPIEVVQWSFYYRGGVSPKDYRALQPAEIAELEAILVPYRAGRLSEAQERLEAAKAARPGFPPFLDVDALLFLARGQVPEAKAALEGVLSQDPADAAAIAILAEVALVQNRLADAEVEANRALAANRESPSAWVAVSHVRQAQSKLDLALEAAAQARALDPQYVRALVQEATLFFWMGRTEEAWTLTQQARALAPGEATTLSLLGFLQLARGEKKTALGTFRQASETDSTLGEPHLGTAIVLLRLGQVVEAVEELETANLLESQAALLRGYLGEGLYCGGVFGRICRKGSRS